MLPMRPPPRKLLSPLSSSAPHCTDRMSWAVGSSLRLVASPRDLRRLAAWLAHRTLGCPVPIHVVYHLRLTMQGRPMLATIQQAKNWE